MPTGRLIRLSLLSLTRHREVVLLHGHLAGRDVQTVSLSMTASVPASLLCKHGYACRTAMLNTNLAGRDVQTVSLSMTASVQSQRPASGIRHT